MYLHRPVEYNYLLENKLMTPGSIGFPTTTCLIEYHRKLSTNLTKALYQVDLFINLIRSIVPPEHLLQQEVILLLYTQKDLFISLVEDCPKIKLVKHRIPTFPGLIPKAAKLPLYIEQQVKQQLVNLPCIEKAGIIKRYISPWAAATKFPPKPNRKLQIVYNYILINSVTIKMNYSIR